MALKTLALADDDSELGSDEILSEINITPLVDVFLVLLIIFMVTSSVLSQMGVDVQLPKASQSASAAESEGVVITLRPDGRTQVNGADVRYEAKGELERVLTQALSRSKSKLVVLEGDQRALLGRAIELMDRAKKSGAAKFAIATAPGGT